MVKNPPAMQGTHVPSLVWEDRTCHGASEPTCHNYRAPTLESRHLEEKPPSMRGPAQPKFIYVVDIHLTLIEKVMEDVYSFYCGRTLLLIAED